MKKIFYLLLIGITLIMLFSCKNVEVVKVETNTKVETDAIIETDVDTDAKIYLDYEAGIEAKVYKWIKSDDGKYFTLAFIDENGEPIKSAEAKINVGANNQEMIDNGDKKDGAM